MQKQTSKAGQLMEAKAESTTDAEAEAVLLALGGHLQWHHKGDAAVICRIDQWEGHGCLDGFDFLDPDDPDVVYLVFKPIRGFKPEHSAGYTALLRTGWRDASGRDDSEITYPDAAAAQAACERHHATGKWE